MIRNKSEELYSQAKEIFPGGVNSPVRAFKSVYGNPVFIEKGEGAYIWDVDDNKYLDFCCSWGPLILGHRFPLVISKITEAVNKGTTFGTPNTYSLQLGQTIINNNRFIEKIRFVSSGTEAVMSAIRLARGYTERSKIIKFEGCYHGHVDHLLVKAGSGLVTFGESSSAGVPQAFADETIVLPLNNPQLLKDTFKKYGDQIAAIIIEPIPANNGLLLQNQSFLELLRSECSQYGSLLIFDEVISGFRVGFEGAAGKYNIQPDIITYGKIIGGGMPVGAFGASKKIMSFVSPDGPVYQAGTLSANPVAMAAGLATIEECLKEGFYENLATKTKKMVDEVNNFCKKNNYPMYLVQESSIFWIRFSEEAIQSADQIDGGKMDYFKKMHQYLLNNGVYLGPSGYEVGFVSHAHTETDLEMATTQFCKSVEVAFA